MYITYQEREKKRNKIQMTTDDNPTTVNYHALLQMKEDTMTYL